MSGIPAHHAALRIERDQMIVDRREIDLIVEHRDSTVRREEPDRNEIPRHHRHVMPERLSRARVQRRDVARRLRHVHDAVHNEGRRLHHPASAHLVGPGYPQARHVLRRDLLESRKTLRPVVAAVHQPIVRLGIRLLEAFVGDLREARQRETQREDKDEMSGGFHWTPFKLERYATRSSRSVAERLL